MELIILSNFIKNYDKILKSNINVEGKMHYIYLLFII